MFLSCGKTFSLHFPSIPVLSVSSIASVYNSRLSTAHKARVALGGNTTITVDDDFSQDEMMRGLAQQAVQQTLKTELQKLDEELGNDYKAKQQVYRTMIVRINREEREDEEGS